MRVLAALLPILCLALVAPPLAAQRVIGRVVEEGTGSVVPTAFVVLLDAGGVRRAAGLTGEEGFFTLEAPGPGEYRLRVDRIGYRSTTGEPFVVTGEGAGPFTIAVPGDAVPLEPIEVEGERRCVLRPEEGESTHALWAEARKALDITDWVGAEDRFVFHVLLFKRFVREPELVVDTETVQLLRIAERQPFFADSADDLLTRGFIRWRGAERAFYGPDAALLLSDAFLDTHCFRRVEGDSGRVGLSFEPIDRKAPAGIRGVLWLERRTAELQHLEFGYVNPRLPRHVDPQRYGGTVRFQRIPDGAWIVSQWKIRSPAFVRAGRRVRHAGFTETEGEVFEVRTPDGSAVPFERVVSLLTGRVQRRGSAEPVPGARVRVLGTPYETVTDEEGRFGVSGLPAGRYHIEAEGPGIRRVKSTIHVQRGETTHLVLSG